MRKYHKDRLKIPKTQRQRLASFANNVKVPLQISTVKVVSSSFAKNVVLRFTIREKEPSTN